MREALVADYPLTRVGVVMFKNDYNRITQPGGIFAVRVPGIYADVANTEDVIVNTNVANGQVSQATGFTAAFGGNTSRSRTLNRFDFGSLAHPRYETRVALKNAAHDTPHQLSGHSVDNVGCQRRCQCGLGLICGSRPEV